jgi:hypothetical protein
MAAGRKFGIGGRDQMFESLTLQAGTFVGDFDAEDALEADDVEVEVIALELLGEVAAGEDAGAGARTRGAFPELLHAGVLRRVVEAPLKAGPK